MNETQDQAQDLNDRDQAVAYLMREGDHQVPCSRFGRWTEDCAPVAVILAEVVAEATGEEITSEALEHAMGLVVNDHDDVASLLKEHASDEQRDWCDYEIPEATVWELLETRDPELEPIADLYSWSTNYNAGEGPFSLFLDLIGWSEENIGEPLYSLENAPSRLGYLELGKLAAALDSYSDHPSAVSEYVEQLMAAEARD
jgi:hypothetical protein